MDVKILFKKKINLEERIELRENKSEALQLLLNTYFHFMFKFIEVDIRNCLNFYFQIKFLSEKKGYVPQLKYIIASITTTNLYIFFSLLFSAESGISTAMRNSYEDIRKSICERTSNRKSKQLKTSKQWNTVKELSK